MAANSSQEAGMGEVPQGGGASLNELPQAAGTGVPYHSASLYVGDLHPDVTEALLFDIFNAVGPVASIRVCRDTVTRRSLGYAYVNFHQMQDAERALDTMNYTQIKDRPCRMMWSQRDPRLRKTGEGNVFVKNLDLSIDNKALYDTFSLFGNILSCKVVTDRDGASQGHGFVHFETTEAAEEAIKKINGMLIAGKEVFVGQFQKRNERADTNMFTNLYVKNVPKYWSEDRMKKLFETVGEVASCVVMIDGEGKSKGFGFVDYMEHESALAALETLDGKELGIDEENQKLLEEAEASGETANEAEGEEGEESEKKNGARVIKLSVHRAQKKAERERELSEKFEQMKQTKYQGVNLYVKNLDEKVTDEILHQEFSQFGSITSVRVMRDTEPAPTEKSEDDENTDENTAEKTDNAEKSEEEVVRSKDGKILGASKGFGFVCFSSSEEAMRAVTEMQGRMILGKPIFVALAQRKENRRAHLDAQFMRRGIPPRGGMGMNPGMYPGAPMYMGGMNPGMMGPGMMPPGAAGMTPRGFGYMPNMAMGGRGMQGGRGGVPYGPVPGQFPGMGQPGMGQPGMGGPGGMMNQQGGRGGRGGGRGGSGRGGPRNGGVGKPGGQQGGFQYKNNVRNQQQMPSQMMQMNPSGMPMQMPVGGPEPLTAAALAAANEQEQKNMIGERLYPLIQRDQPDLASKITGMLLEMENPELLHLLESPVDLQKNIQEALDVLKKHAEEN